MTVKTRTERAVRIMTTQTRTLTMMTIMLMALRMSQVRTVEGNHLWRRTRTFWLRGTMPKLPSNSRTNSSRTS